MDAQGHLHLRPFFYPLRLREGSFDQYEEDTASAVPVRFFTRGAAYRLLGFIPSRLHLFGATGARIHLLGSDAYGRDQLSRILYGGQVSLLAGLLGAGVTLFLGALIGMAAGYFGGWRDDLLMRVAELFLALPGSICSLPCARFCLSRSALSKPFFSSWSSSAWSDGRGPLVWSAALSSA